MRYLITKEKPPDREHAPAVLRAYAHPHPPTYEQPPDEDKTHSDFPFSEEGLDMACGWLNEQYENRTDFWLHTPNF